MKDGLLKNFNGYKFGPNIYFGQIQPDLHNPADKRLRELLKPGDIYMAVQDIEAPGAWNWYTSPPEAFEVIGVSHDVYKDPLFTLIRRI